MAIETRALRLRVRNTPPARLAELRWPASAWGAIGVTALFIGITCWWISKDHTVPIYDAGLHLAVELDVYHQLSAGHLGAALTAPAPYPPFAYLVGSLGILVGGVGIPSMVIAENLVFATLLALGCYQVGRLAFGPPAGLGAVVFALGSPLLAAQFHVFMLDAPETAMVAVSVWLVIASAGFAKLRVCALAGVTCGLGVLTKEPFPIFVLGVVAVTAVRGGWASWRGLTVFAAVAGAIALPWYVTEWPTVSGIVHSATGPASAIPSGVGSTPSGIAPPRLSPANLEWYFWVMVNTQLLVPLFVLAAAGWVWVMRGLVRGRPVSRLAPELAVGSFVAWAALTETYFHDTRYGMPLLIYPAVFAGGWIASLRGRWRGVGTVALGAAVCANTLGTTFGVGTPQRISLPIASRTALESPGTFTFYSDGFLVSGPRRDGDLLGMLQALRRAGVRLVTWTEAQGAGTDFSNAGVIALAQIAGVEPEYNLAPQILTAHDAFLNHHALAPSGEPPCVTLDDHTGVWVRIGNPLAPGAQDYCPVPVPHYYGSKQR